VHWYQRALLWWRLHPWIPVWGAVLLTPVVLFCLRLVDDSDIAVLVQPILGVTIVLFLGVVAVAIRRSASVSPLRTLAGTVGALLAVGVIAVPMTHVIGQRSCPERMGPDRGLQASAQLFEAWRRGEALPAEGWVSPTVADEWRARARPLTLLNYKLVDSGCWERLAPVTTDKTWHEYRVIVRRGDGDAFSKVVTVHTGAARGGWVISGVEGPEY
jgi:hypothetical protein